MTVGRRVALVVVWVLSLVGVGVWAGSGEVRIARPHVVSGEDLGFQVVSIRGNTRIGRLVVRIDGKWVDVQFAPGIVPAGK